MFWNKDKIPNLKLEDDEDLFREDDTATFKEVKEDFTSLNEETLNSNEEEQITDVIEKNRKINIVIINKVINIILIATLIVSLLVSIDIICVSRFDKGPFFAIKTKTYNDGGTKEYYGLFYKVIKYKEKKGRVDNVIGSWDIYYNNTPINVDMLDLSLSFNNNLDKSINLYMDKYLKVEGEISNINNSEITLKYNDDENKYNTILKCNMLEKSKKYKKKDKVKIVGTLYNYSNNNVMELYMKNCYFK